MIFLLFGLNSCSETEKQTISFSMDIQPIFEVNCAYCHGPGGDANLDLTSYETTMGNESDYGYVVIPNEPDNSYLYIKVSPDNTTGNRMPLGSNPLTAEKIRLVYDWIYEGAEDN